MRLPILFLVLCVQVVAGHGQLIELSGVVLDKVTAEPLPFVYVSLEDSTRSVMTDVDGRFTFDRLPQGAHTFIVGSIEYERTRFEGVEVRPGKQWVEFRVAQRDLGDGPPVIIDKRRPWPWRWFKR